VHTSGIPVGAWAGAFIRLTSSIGKGSRRLRRLVPDEELVRRRAAGEPLRALAADYGVAHTTLIRYFARSEVAMRLREARRSVLAERRVARQGLAAEQREDRRLVREARQKAKAQAAEARARAAWVAAASARPPRGSDFAEWLDDRDARQSLTRAERRSGHDEQAAAVVAQGGGIEALVQATGLRTRTNVLRLIDPTIVVGALANDAATRRSTPPAVAGLRRLAPDGELVRRRAAGEPLRTLARDYGIAHTTLSRYFARPAVASQLGLLTRKPVRSGSRATHASFHARSAGVPRASATHRRD
jgi:hypothetical protein